HALRGALHTLAAVCLVGRATRRGDLDTLDAERRRLARGERLVERDGRIETEWWSEEAALDAPLWPVVRSAVSLFTDPEAVARLGRCDGERCGWLFADFGRGRRRRWCDMADCGNVAKVRAHRARGRRDRTRRSP
ncbi:MAG TPA: CGNR zinc finger domain-containing protein, partial [Longimicrobiales bacterium]|nr:CGNR zinc finger domain-containing protein [Longimicrobiales bacterium]